MRRTWHWVKRDWVQLAAAIMLAVAWGDLRAEVRSLRRDLTRIEATRREPPVGLDTGPTVKDTLNPQGFPKRPAAGLLFNGF